VITDDEIRSLAISQRLLGTHEVILIHHTDCGMLTFSQRYSQGLILWPVAGVGKPPCRVLLGDGRHRSPYRLD
jgi:hypothetical protein